MMLTIKDIRVFDALVKGNKRYEGRRWKEEFSSVKEGDLVVFVLEGGQELLVSRIRELRRYSTIKDMVLELWRDLLPFAKEESEALNYYRRFYSLDEPAVAIEVEPVLHIHMGQREINKWLGIKPEPLRVAVGVEKGELFSGHFGDAPEFWIFHLWPDRWELIDKRKNTTQEHDDEHEEHHGNPAKFRAVYSLLRDSDVWLAFRMGPNYIRIVQETSIIPFVAGTRDLETALNLVRRQYLSLFLRRHCRGDRHGQ